MSPREEDLLCGYIRKKTFSRSVICYFVKKCLRALHLKQFSASKEVWCRYSKDPDPRSRAFFLGLDLAGIVRREVVPLTLVIHLILGVGGNMLSLLMLWIFMLFYSIK